MITIGEIKKGSELLPDDSKRKQDLTVWLNDELLKRFSDRIYPVTVDIMPCWGTLFSRLDSAGLTVSTMDSLIAATALSQQAILVSRNEDHFLHAGVQIINLWN